MQYLLRLFLSAVAVALIAYILPGVSVSSFLTAVIVALVLSLLNLFVKPVLVLFTLPATILSLGLFLLVINAALILIADYLVAGFQIAGFWTALLFSFLLSVFQSILYGLGKETSKSKPS